MSFFSDLYRDIAIDFGTTNTLIFIRGLGIVLNEPSIVARNSNTGKVLAIGHEALRIKEKTHTGIVIIRPFVKGAISDYQSTEELIIGMIRKITTRFSFGFRRMVITIPSGITAVEKRAVRDFAHHIGAKQVYLVTCSMAAAVGLGLEINEPTGNMVIDIGGGTTEIAVISLGGVASGESLKVAGSDMTDLIIGHFRKTYNLAISETRAEEIKIRLSSAFRHDEERTMAVRGVNVENGLPVTREVDSLTIRDVIATPVSQIITAIKKSLEVLVIKPEISVDILDRGIFIVGGGALISGLDKKIMEETTLGVHICEEPVAVVAKGAGEILENIEKYKAICTE